MSLPVGDLSRCHHYPGPRHRSEARYSRNRGARPQSCILDTRVYPPWDIHVMHVGEKLRVRVFAEA